MSRKWKNKDNIYVYKENKKIKNEVIEELINKINISTEESINIPNIVSIYDEKINEIKESGINVFSIKNNYLVQLEYVMNKLIKDAELELIKIYNKINDEKYKLFKDTKFVYLIIKDDLYKYNKLIGAVKDLSLCYN